MDPTQLLLRPVQPEDAAALNELRRLPSVLAFTMSLPSERVSFNRAFIEHLAVDDHMLVAEVAGRVVGMAGLHVQAGKRRHVGVLGLSVRDDFQGRGIGRSLMAALLDLADNVLALVRVELEVYVANTRAVA